MGTLYDMLDYGSQSNDPYKIIVHAMGERIDDGDIYSARDFLDKIKLSAHVLIKPDGDVIRCRHDKQGAYHAIGHNEDSLGVEFLVNGTHTYGSFIEAIKGDYITPEQYQAGIEVINMMIAENNIKMILRHSDVSPGRKLDPGTGFKWQWFKKQLKSI
jgi:N-acetyl-anhydromuramyl-L-alanine amidase AmpD